MARLLKIKRINIGIVGNGYVGQATSLLKCDSVKTIIYDADPEKCDPLGVTLGDLSVCHIIFVCVPTPMNYDGSCHTAIVEEVIKDLKLHAEKVPIVVRSTVPVGFCDSMGVNFMPEFLTERNWKDDVSNAKDWIVGTFDADNVDFKEKTRSLLKLACQNNKLKNPPIIHFMSNETAELCKYSRNCFLATKVSFFNELEKFCSKKDIPYELVREAVCLDERVGESHTSVPGPDGEYGFGGTCFPKDMASLEYQMTKSGLNPELIQAAIRRNLVIDRPEKDWENDKGRAVAY
jgi:UDPglucose 6-dehydrogenase